MGNIFSVDSPSCNELVQPFLPFLPFLCGKWKHFYNQEENLEALQKEMQDLNAMRNDLLKRVSKEEDRGLQRLQEVKGWISMVEEIEPKANRLLDGSVSKIRRPSTYDYSEDVAMTLKKVEDLRSKGVFEVVIDRALPSLVVKMPPIQLTVSQEKLLERAWKFLSYENALGIYGGGGVGKTTLITKIKKKFLEAVDEFDLVIFVVVASEEVESIQEEISKRLGLQWERETKKEKAAEILRVLKGKRFVLLLDDIQKEVDLEEIGVPFPSRENGCKIVFTTRSQEACRSSKWVDSTEVTCLSPEESWDLFQKTVGENKLRSHPDIPKLARVVASSCRGLPLALNLIGETMARKRTVSDWRYTIHVLASSTAEFPVTEYGFLPILKSIYDNMSGENIRLCFLYCALFPKNCDMRKEDLVDYWIGEGIIAKEDRGMAEIQGNEMIGDLVRMRLLMEDESGYCVKMHGMVRQMALWIASDSRMSKVNFLVKFGERINQMLMVDNWSMVRWMSVTSTQIANISDSPACSELTTLFLQGNSNLEWISGDFFRWMTSLVVLNLSSNRELAVLPEEISNLVSLRFLNLSFTSIKRLPLGMKELTRLIHLDLEHTHELRDINVIASLLNLQVLRLLWSVPLDISLMEIIHLLKSLKELSLTVKEYAVLERLISIHRLASCIRRLHLKRITITDGGISLLNAMFSLRELHVDECDIPEIAIDRRSNTIERMIACFGNIEKIPQLRNIRTVSLHGCKGLRDLTWLLLAPNLGDLRISECLQIQRITSMEKAVELGCTSEQPFQNLTRLSLIGLPELDSIYWTRLPFPAPEIFEIRGCPKLRIHPFNSESAYVQIELGSSSESTLHYNVTLKEVKALRSEGVSKVLVERAPLSHVKKMLPLQPIVSQEMLLEKAWKCLEENEYQTLGLYGTAGVGKTTLLTQIKNKFIEVGDVSRLVIFVVVESEGVEGIQVTILKKLGLYRTHTSEREKANEIYKLLSSKRFVLLLDGVQREGVDLERIGVPQPSRENGCKIVFTTRSQEACRSSKWVDSTEVEVECLSPEEAWDFFQEIVGETTLRSHPNIPHLARIVAIKCGGLPIALNLIGKTMSRKRTVREWHHAIHVLVSSAAQFSGREVPLLEFAYDNLPGEDIKSCFLYCAVFPKNSDISKQDLVDCLIGEGIIADEEDREIAETKGYEMIGDLVIMGFLMENESGYGVKMHDMVLEMALWIASDSGRRNENIFVKCGGIIHELPMVNDWNMVRRMSVTSTQIVSISDSHPYTELKTLFLQENANLKRISGEFFRWMTSLVVLNLSSNRELRVLPEEVSNLVSLRFLNLSRSGIRRLPLALKKLKKLIHLDLDYVWHLVEIVVIASLLNLQVLRLFWSVPVDLGLMEIIHLLKSLKELNLTVVEEVTVFQQLQSNHRLASCIRRLRLERITITEGGILSLNSGISELYIDDCDIPEITIDWRSTIQREAVHSGNIDKIPQFRNIRKVTFTSCKGLRDMTWLLFAPSLEDLILIDCPQMEEVISKEKAMPQLGHTSEHPFQNLTRVILYDLPKLESIYWTPLPFPVLEYLSIRRCPKLRRLPFNSESAKGNQVRLKIDEKCIGGVEWENRATKQRVSGLNIPWRFW